MGEFFNKHYFVGFLLAAMGITLVGDVAAKARQTLGAKAVGAL